MDIKIISKKNEYVETWINWQGVVPSVGDTIVVSLGDFREIPVNRPVLERIIDGKRPSMVTLIIDPD